MSLSSSTPTHASKWKPHIVWNLEHERAGICTQDQMRYSEENKLAPAAAQLSKDFHREKLTYNLPQQNLFLFFVAFSID